MGVLRECKVLEQDMKTRKKNLSPVIVNCVFRVTLPRILQFQDLLEPVCIQNYCLYFYHYSFIDMSIFTAVPR